MNRGHFGYFKRIHECTEEQASHFALAIKPPDYLPGGNCPKKRNICLWTSFKATGASLNSTNMGHLNHQVRVIFSMIYKALRDAQMQSVSRSGAVSRTGPIL